MANYTFTQLTHPLSLNQSTTTALSINNDGNIVGAYLQSNLTTHGYIHTGGNYTTLTYPVAPGSNDSHAVMINDGGDIIGKYNNGDPNSVSYYLYDISTQTFTPIDHPLAAYPTAVNGFNDAAHVVGSYQGSSGWAQGFIYSGGVYATLIIPEATGFYGSTTASDINNLGHIVGTYTQSDYASNGVRSTHAFMLSGATVATSTLGWSSTASYSIGDIIVVSDPNAGNPAPFAFVSLTDNNQGHIPTTPGASNPLYWASLMVVDDWIYTGTVTTLTFPGSDRTEAVAINDADDVLGFYLDSNNVKHYFLYDGATYITLDAPSAGAGGTVATALNDNGDVVGYYVDGGGIDHGFVYSDGTYSDLGAGVIPNSINNSGQIVGQGPNGAFLGTPIATPAPEISVKGNNVNIADGDTTPSLSEDTEFGAITRNANNAALHVFTVSNTGVAALTISNLTLPTGFILVEGLSGSIVAGASDTFTVKIDTGTIGTFAGNIVISSNDADENPFNFAIHGEVVGSDAVVSGNGVTIADNDTTPSAGDHTDFGDVVQGGTAVQRTFTVTNNGNGTLDTSNLTLPTGFTLVEGLNAAIAPGGGSDTFTVRMDTATIGTKSGQISFGTNDSDSNPYNFTITGRVGAPEVAVTGNGVNIVDNDTTPSATDDTAFGTVLVGAGVQHVFTITNSGNATLTTSNLIIPNGFILIEGLSGPIAPGGSDTITVALDTSNTGTKSGQISFANNDASENPFNFTISGTVNPVPVAPEITVLGNATNIADNDTTPSTLDDTDFGSAVLGNSVIRTFTVWNDGTGTLTTSSFKLPKGFILVEGLSTSIAPHDFDTFQIRLDTSTIGIKSGQISFGSNDSNENPFNFSITGAVTTGPMPEIAVSGNGLNIADNDTAASLLDHTDFGSVAWGGSVVRTFTVTNSGTAALNISNFALPGGFLLVEGLSSSIAPGGFDTFQVALDTSSTGVRTGTITFNTNDADENPFNFAINGSVTPEIVTGDDNDNTFVARAHAELFFGLGGNDTVSYELGGGVVASLKSATKNTGYAAGDTYNSIENLIGSPGNDTLTGNTGSNVLEGGAGADQIDGGTGTDTASYAHAGAGLTVNLLNLSLNTNDASGDTYKNIERFLGSGHNDIFIGNTAANTFDGGGGDDNLNGGLGNDILVGGPGADTLTGGGGIDTASYIADTAGIDVNMNLGGAQSGGEAQGDIFVGITNVTGGLGDDWITGNALANTLQGGEGDDTIDGGPGNDILAGGGNTTVGDTVDYTSAGLGVTVNLSLTNAQDTKGAGLDTLSGFENIFGSVFNDQLTGDNNVNIIDGADGHDALFGGGADDTLRGGSGDDALWGGLGADHLDGGGGAVDGAMYGNATTAIVVNMLNTALNTGEAAGDTYTDINMLWGGAFGDTFTADNSGMQLFGNGGNDILVGGDQNGTDPGDVLGGGAGTDTLTGGLGRDQFHFTSPSNGMDTITDFVSGTDNFIFTNFDPGGAAGFGLTAAADGGPGPAHWSGAHLLAAGYFVTGTAANTSHAQFIFDASIAGHHTLYFDPDGTGSKVRIALADVLNATVAPGDLGYFA